MWRDVSVPAQESIQPSFATHNGHRVRSIQSRFGAAVLTGSASGARPPVAKPRSASYTTRVFWLTSLSAQAVTEAELREALEQFNRGAQYALPLDVDYQKLAAGRLVRVRQRGSGPDAAQQVIGLRIVDLPRDQMWVGARDPHFSQASNIQEVSLYDVPQGKVWYQLFDVPRPFHDRHWVITVLDNHSLAELTEGKAWEHYWQITEGGEELAAEAIEAGRVPGVTPPDVENAVWTPINRGAYLGIRLNDTQTLWGFHVSLIISGNIPDGAVAEYSMMSLRGMFDTLTENATQAATHYLPPHAEIPDGGGQRLPWLGPHP